MPKHPYYYECDHCHKVIYQGLEDGLLVFCNATCRIQYYDAHAMSHTIFREQARDFLLKDLKAEEHDPDFPRWLNRCAELFSRYKPLQEIFSRPLGTSEPGDNSPIVDECLDMLERKIKAAEDTLGLT